MTVMPVPVAPPDMPSSEPPAKRPAPGFDHALKHAQRDDDSTTRTPDRDSGPKADKPASGDKSEKSNDKEDTATPTTPGETAATPTNAGLTDNTVVALLAALTGVVGDAETADSQTTDANATDPHAPTPTTGPTTTVPAAAKTVEKDTSAAAAAQTTSAETDKPAPAPAGPAPEAAKPATTDAAAAATAAVDNAPRPPMPVAPPRPVPAPVANTALAVAPVEPRIELATTEAVVPTAAAAPAPPPPPADQLLAAMRPLQRNADGSYQIRIEMRPPELGRVEMRVELRDGVLHASIHAEHAQTVEIVRNALDDLRARLGAEGVHAGELTVDDGRAGTSDREQRQAGPEGRDEPTATTAASAVGATTTSSRPDALLDVRI